MQDTRGALVHRLQFLNVVQQLARADVESAAAAVGLDVLQGVVSLASPRLAEGVGRYTGRPTSGVRPRDRSSSVTQKATKIIQTRRLLNTSNHVRNTLSSSLKSIHVEGGSDDGLKEVVAPHLSMGEVVVDDRGRKHPASGINSRGTLAARSSPSRVSPHDIETLRNIIFGGDNTDSRRKEATSFSNGRSDLKHARPEWDNRFGVKQTSGPKVSSRQKHNPLPLSKLLAPLTEDTSGGGCEKSANTNNKPDDQQRVGASILERPPIGPQHSLPSTGGAVGSASFSQGGGGSPIAAEGQTSLGNSVGGGGALLNATSSIDEIAAATNRSETPLAGSRARRGSAVKARPRPKAAGGHATGGSAVAAGQALRPSDFSAVDAEQRRLSQRTPMFSPSPTGLASSVAGVAPGSNNPIQSSARGNSLSASGTPGVAAGGSYHPNSGTQHLSPSVTPTKSGGALRPGSLNASPSNPPLTPLGVEESTTALTSARGGADSTTNNASTSPLPADALESPSKGSAARDSKDEELRAAENVRLLALAKAEALQIEQQQRQQQILQHVSSLVENMLSEHTEIVDKQMISSMPRGMHDALDVDNTFQGRTRRKLRDLEEKQERDALRIRGKMAEELAVLEYGQNTQQREVAGELELDRVIRRFHEQEFVERAMGERSATDTRDDVASRKQSVPRRHGMGHIPAATINRILKSASESHEVVRYNERLWNTSSTSQYAFCDRLAGLLLEDLLSEIAYEEVDVMLSEYIDGLAAHELQI